MSQAVCGFIGIFRLLRVFFTSLQSAHLSGHRVHQPRKSARDKVERVWSSLPENLLRICDLRMVSTSFPSS
jgi:hypothetical protein